MKTEYGSPKRWCLLTSAHDVTDTNNIDFGIHNTRIVFLGLFNLPNQKTRNADKIRRNIKKCLGYTEKRLVSKVALNGYQNVLRCHLSEFLVGAVL
jgi:hypothetical protein